jgi:hypothetical protein
MEGMFTKMWDPPRESIRTPPDLINVQNLPPGARANPVPAFMQSLGLGGVTTPNTVDLRLLDGLTIPTWDNAKMLMFMTFRDRDFVGDGVFPGPTLRVPRGVIFHCNTQGTGPPPHTIHWHGIEPTPMNDGVGHCSMEIGQYTYQWQPNFIGTYFYHCHRNTVQHFEFGLYGMLLIEPPDAYDPAIPIIAGGPNKNVGGYPRRMAANLGPSAVNPAGFPQFPGFVGGDATFGVGGALDVGVGDPHAFTVPYDVECLWVCDDRDSVWSDLAGDAKAFYPGGANTQDGPNALVPVTRPGVDDQFPHGFFNDFNADYWFITGVPVPAARGGTATINPAGAAPAGGGLPGGLIPPNLNGGVTGMRVDVDAQVNQTVLIRILDAAYNSIDITFPVDVVITAGDGRALGVPPFARYNHAFLHPADTPFRLSTARRIDVLVRSAVPVVDRFATVQFYDNRGENVPGVAQTPLVTARIPFRIRA